MKVLNRLLRSLGEPNLSRGGNLDLVERIHSRLLQPHLGGPYELHARAVAQFHGMLDHRTGLQSALRRAASIPLLAAFLFKNAVRGWRQEPVAAPERVDGVKTGGEIPEYELPPELRGFIVRSWPKGVSFLPWREAMGAMGGLLAVGCWEPEVHYKSLLAMAAHAGLFRQYAPSFVVMYKEYDFVCSMLTLQCRTHGVQSYNVMHGDKAYFARDAFFAVDRHYVWHAGYGDMAREMKASIGDVVVYTPDRMRPPDHKLAPTSDVLVILPGIEVAREDQERWVLALERISTRHRIRVRPHPRNQCNQRIREVLGWSQVELSDPAHENAIQAIRSSRAVVGSHSTVLIESYCQGIPTICIRDERFAQISDYHPFLKQEGMWTADLEGLSGLLDTLLEDAGATPSQMQVPGSMEEGT